MGKGGGGGGQTQSTVTNTNIPEYARGYVENMLGATQRELFSGEEGPNGEFNITGFKPYKSYGGTYDESGNMTSYDPSAAVAGFTPMQQMAQNGIYNLQMPGEFGSASEYTANAMQRAANAGYDAGQFTMGQAQAPNVNYFQMQGPQDVRGEAAQNTYLGQAPTYRGQQLNYTPQNIGFERVNAPKLRDLQMRSAGNVGTQSFTQPGAQQRFMDPYMQNVVDTQTREAQRMADRAAVQRRGARAQQGAYGGSAAALENAEANRNLATQLGDIQAKGSQAAYQSGMGQFNTEAQNRLQADLANQQVQQQTGVQNLSAALQTQGLGAQTGLTAQQLNQAAGIDTSKFNQTQQYNTALQNAQLLQQQQLANQALQGQYGLTQGQLSQANNQFNAQQRQAANLANQQMGYNVGNQNLQANLGVQQLGAGQNLQAQLANQQMLFNTQQAGEQSRQFGANYGQQMNAQQLAAAQQLGGLGQQRLTAQQGIYGLQNQIGGQQQQYQQQIINQAMQDYSNAQQYPMMQLGTMSNMLRGLPMQATTTNMYQAAPNAISQGIGAVGAYGALNNAFGAPTGGAGGARPYKEGGAIRGGIMSYDVGGEIESTLSKMGVDDLKKYAKESSSPSVKQMAARLIQEKSMPVPRMARGGILAFAKGDKVKELREANEEGLASPDELTAMDVQYRAPTGKEMWDTQAPFMDRSGYDAMVERTKDYVYPERPRAPAPTAFQTLTSERPINIPTGASGFPRINAPTPPAAPTAPPPVAPPPQGIAQAAAATAPPRPPVAPAAAPPAGPAPAPAAPSGPSFPNRPSIPDLPEEAVIRANAEKATTAADRPLSAFVEEGKEALRASGITPENTGLQEYRSRIMAERANMDDEAKRQKNLRLAEFFASWGSTPGATLVAGMTALKKTIPTLIEDEKERKKALRETDKIIYDLDQADRLEKKGLASEASSKKDKVAERAEKLNTELARSAEAKRRDAITAQGHEADFVAKNAATAASERSSKYSADLRLQGDLAHAAASKANAEAAREGNNFNKAQTAYQLAQNARLTVDKEYDTVINGKAYMQAKQDVANLSNNETPQIKARVAESHQYITDVENDFKARREMMNKSVKIAENRLNSISGGAVLPTEPSTAPATVAPPGHTLAGYTPDGKPVYKNAQGKTFVGQ